MIEAKSLHEDRRVLDRSSSDISELMLRVNQGKQVLINCRTTEIKLSPGETFGILISS